MTEPNGLYYMKARYYDSEVGRFISEDPLGFEGGSLNLYVYAANNPIMFMDPNGLCINAISDYLGDVFTAPNYEELRASVQTEIGYTGREDVRDGLIFGGKAITAAYIAAVGAATAPATLGVVKVGYEGTKKATFSPIGQFTTGFGQGFTAGMTPGAEMPPTVLRWQIWGQQAGNMAANLISLF
jgi:RHS repeat-associated protein